MIRRIRSTHGFTLIELLVVVAIVGILAAVAVGNYKRNIVRAKEAVLKENLFTMRTQISNYFSDKGHHPNDLRSLVDDHYLKSVPQDPITGSADTWVVDYADLTDEDISLEPGIDDVHSGATGVSVFEGTRYADW